jgi:hypothetical protein
MFQYPDGSRDAETLLLDPLTKDIYVISKREFEDIRVYRAPYPTLWRIRKTSEYTRRCCPMPCTIW